LYKVNFFYIKDNLRDTDEAAFEFAVGDHVFASRRKVPPLNEEGMVAIVTGRRFVQRNDVYDIKYLLTKNVEKDIAAEGVIVKYDFHKQTLRHSSKTTSGKRCITFSCSDVLPKSLRHRRLCCNTAANVVDADDLEQPEIELAMASLWPVPDALGGCSDAADAAVGGGAGLGAMSTSGGAVGKDGDTRRDRAHIQRLPAVPGQVPAQPVVETAQERRGHGPQQAGLE
jgi:hypothetical protein